MSNIVFKCNECQNDFDEANASTERTITAEEMEYKTQLLCPKCRNGELEVFYHK